MRTLAVVALSSLLSLLPHPAQAQFLVVPGVRVTIAPPPLRLESAPRPPSPRHQWIAGYWGWRGGAHVWIAGHWALAPAAGYIWEPAWWENVEGAWMFHEGHWRTVDPPEQAQVYQPPPPPVEEVVVDEPPPQPIEEIRPPPPFPAAVWIGGNWHWSGARYVWVAGRWSPRPAAHEWERARWERRHDGKWVHRPGHWHPR